jgi:hypothetical protein
MMFVVCNAECGLHCPGAGVETSGARNDVTLSFRCQDRGKV